MGLWIVTQRGEEEQQSKKCGIKLEPPLFTTPFPATMTVWGESEVSVQLRTALWGYWISSAD